MYKIQFARVKLSNLISKSKFLNTNQMSIHLFPLMHLYALHELHALHICLWSIHVCNLPRVKNCYARSTHAKAKPSKYEGKIRGWHLFTIITIYTQDTIHIRRHKQTRTATNTIYWHLPVPGLHGRIFFCPLPPHVLCGHRGPPSWSWQEWNRLLRLGRPWGAVTLSRWCMSGDRGGCSARRGLKPKFY